jgi:membrane-bound lytic murein transglycosylase D
LAALLLIVLVVTVLVVATQYREGEEQEDALRQAADEVFYNLRALEGNLVRLRRLDPLSSDLREATYRRGKLTQAYDSYIELLGLYDGLSQTEIAVLRMARRLGEADFKVPEDFHTLAMTYVQRWFATGRLGAAIARARERNLIQRIRRALDERGLPREFLFVVLQESNFDTSLVGPLTPTGVPKGLWQLTPKMATEYGLILGPLSSEPVFDPADERHDEDRSTAAAIDYLADVYSSKAAASALLAIASYNVGEGVVLRRLEELPNDPRDRNFWNFYRNQWLSEEGRDYVMAIFSAALICEQPELFHAPFGKIW